MAKGLEKETKEPEEETKELEEKIPTLEEQLDTLKAELAKTKTDLADAQVKIEGGEGFKSIQRTLLEKDKQLKQSESDKADFSALSAKVEILGGIIAEFGQHEEASLEEMPPRKKVDYARKFQEVEAAARMRAQIEPRQRRAQSFGLPMDDSRIATVEYLTTGGQFAKADKMLDSIEAEVNESKEKKVEKEETPKETEAERIERLVEEKTRKVMEERGWLESETGGPSASSGSWLDFEKRYIQGKVSVQDYETRARKEGKL